MSEHKRLARIEGIDLGTGTFSMTLATEGEASDGDILSIQGGQIPERMPMLTSHWNEPSAQLGSITNPEKLLKDSPPRLRATGRIEMGGEGASAEIRRDLAHMIDKGHVTGVSIRWDEMPGSPPVRRVNLPSDHAYFVDAEGEKDHRKRYGLYFEKWRALEGSVVALGADPEALIGRADETDGAVSTFWRSMATDAIDEDQAEALIKRAPQVIRAAMCEDEPAAKIAASLAALRIEATACLEAGASHADCINAVTDGTHSKIEAVELGDFIVFLPEPEAQAVRALIEADILIEDEDPEILERLEALETALDDRAVLEDSPPSVAIERVPAAPLSALTLDLEQVRDPINVEALAALMSHALDEYAWRLERGVQEIFDLRVGKVK